MVAKRSRYQVRLTFLIKTFDPDNCMIVISFGFVNIIQYEYVPSSEKSNLLKR